MNGAGRPRHAGRQARELARLTALSAWGGLEGFYKSDDLTYAASIAYYGLLSLFPISLLAFTILGRATASDGLRTSVFDFVLQYFPTQFSFITQQLDAFRTDTITFGIAGSAAIVWGALGVFGAISTAVNYAWGVEETRSYWKHKLFSFVMLIVAGVILVVAVLLVSASQAVSAGLLSGIVVEFPWLRLLGGFTIRQTTTLLFMLVVGLIYYFVPNAKVRFRDVWVGALVTGLLWKGTLVLFTIYIGDMSRFTRVNGSIAAVVVFLVWMYVQAVILLYGVEFTAAYARLRRGRPADVPAAATPRL